MSFIPKILICDDDEDILTLLSMQVKSLGYDLVCCNNASDAYQVLSDDLNISVMITDIMMANMTGLDLIETLIVTESPIRVIVLTGIANDEKVKKLNYTPIVTQIMSKPWDRDNLDKAIKNALGINA